MKRCHWWSCKRQSLKGSGHCVEHRPRFLELLKEGRARRIRLGLCADCTAKAYKWGRCRRHHAAGLASKRRLLAERIARKQCVRCKESLPIKRRTVCDNCIRKRQRARDIRWARRNPGRYAELHRRAALAWYHRQRKFALTSDVTQGR